mmetsp:Transcript_61338/g.155812  ORF Transcript_61338/g.155812 Transcript_61338/m.155812 type:complete len:220 (-) Transcript_61338:53-712(-)
MSQQYKNTKDRRLSAAKQLLMDGRGFLDHIEGLDDPEASEDPEPKSIISNVSKVSKASGDSIVSLAYSESTNQDALCASSEKILDHSFLSTSDDKMSDYTAALSAEKAPTALPGKMGEQEKTRMEPRRNFTSETLDTIASDGSIPLQFRTLIEEEDFWSFEREFPGGGPEMGSDAILRGDAAEPPPLPASAAAWPVVKSMWFSFCCSGGDVDRNEGKMK